MQLESLAKGLRRWPLSLETAGGVMTKLNSTNSKKGRTYADVLIHVFDAGALAGDGPSQVTTGLETAGGVMLSTEIPMKKGQTDVDNQPVCSHPGRARGVCGFARIRTEQKMPLSQVGLETAGGA